MPLVKQLYIYPIKSCGGISLAESPVGPSGLEDDRRYMLIDDRFGEALTQRQFPKLAAVKVDSGLKGFAVSAPGMNSIILPYRPDELMNTDAKLWDSRFGIFLQKNSISDWFRRYLGTNCLLAGLPDHSMRKKEFLPGMKGEIACHDSSPIHIVSESSVADFNSSLKESVPCLENRFRPNIVLAGCPAYAEESWKRIRVGKAILVVRKKTPRCPVIDVAQDSGFADPVHEVLGALGRSRKGYFGVYAFPEYLAPIKVGDEVTVIA